MAVLSDDAKGKMEQALGQTLSAAQPVGQVKINQADLILNTKGVNEVIKGNQRPAFVWMLGPAMLKINVTGDRRLSRVKVGDAVSLVQYVRAAVQKGTKVVYLWPTDENDPEKIEVLRYNRAAWVNLVEMLAPIPLTVESGYMDSFSLEYSKPTDSVYPALKFDMSKRIERKPMPKPKKKKKSANAQQQPGSANTDRKPDGKSEPEPEGQAEA